jgi:hypothetical protein
MDIGCFCLCMICYHINSFCCGWSTKLMTLLYAITMWHLSTFFFSSCGNDLTCKQEMQM